MFDDDDTSDESVDAETFAEELRSLVDDFFDSQDSDVQQTREKWLAAFIRHLGIEE